MWLSYGGSTVSHGPLGVQPDIRVTGVGGCKDSLSQAAHRRTGKRYISQYQVAEIVPAHESERIEQAWSVVRLGVVAWLQRHHGLRIQGFDLTSVTRASRADLRQTVIGVVLGWML